jgi:ABC-type branched-subunit amino acid transport system substrate-binding protein
VTEKEILVGMSNGQTGPTSELGNNMKAGATVYFNKVNAAGGIGGRKIKLIVRDDNYQPPLTIANTKKFIEEDKVFALFGYIGSPNSAAIVPTVTRAGVPYLFPLTGAEVIRNPVNKFIFNVRASYADEVELMVERLTQDLHIQNSENWGLCSRRRHGRGGPGRSGTGAAEEEHELSGGWEI